MAKLINETTGDLPRAPQLALITGMSQGELFGQEWKGIDFEKRRLRVERAVAEVKKKDLRLKTEDETQSADDQIDPGHPRRPD